MRIINCKSSVPLPDNGNFNIHIAIRFVEKLDGTEPYLGMDFTIDSDTIPLLINSQVSFIIDNLSKKIPLATQKNSDSPTNRSFRVWFSIPIEKSFLKSICDAEDIDIRIITQIGNIDVNFDNPAVKRELILVCKQFYNGVIDNQEYVEDINDSISERSEDSTNYNFYKSFLKPFLLTFFIGFPIVLLILILTDDDSNEDIDNQENIELQNQEGPSKFNQNNESDINMTFCDCWDWLADRDNFGENLSKDAQIYNHCKGLLNHGPSAQAQKEFDRKLGDCD
ncbi:hypothetical protein N8203_03205 [Crocinitomicaceae bacterium]|nr:hypothetical protein [Crocinitomicaceae bacterium]